MADNLPNMPAGAVPSKPAEGAKIQPKKETVRINLPPKPSAGPSVRLPAPPSAGAPPPPAATPVPAAPPSSGSAAAAAPVSQRPAAAVSAPGRPMVGGMVPRAVGGGPEISFFDKAVALAAALIGVALLVHMLLLSGMLTGE